MRTISEALDRIRDSIQEADRAFHKYIYASGSQSDFEAEHGQIAEYYLERAFLELEFFLEQHDAPVMLKRVVSDRKAAASKLLQAETTPYGDPVSYWCLRLEQYLRAVETTLGTAGPSQITKELVEILRATAYAITDKSCFSSPPSNELDVHVRVEAVLRCVFPDLRHKPPIGKPIKNFEPDTGLPSVRTLIEYKFVSTDAEVKRVADEVLADTRGYVSKDWDQFVYLIYEARRLRPESQWKELLSNSGVGVETQIIVIAGELPGPKRERSKKYTSASGRGRSRTKDT